MRFVACDASDSGPGMGGSARLDASRSTAGPQGDVGAVGGVEVPWGPPKQHTLPLRHAGAHSRVLLRGGAIPFKAPGPRSRGTGTCLQIVDLTEEVEIIERQQIPAGEE